MSKHIEEELEVGFRAVYRIDKILHSGKSEFQTVDVVDLAPFGRTLLIDGMIQSCQVRARPVRGLGKRAGCGWICMPGRCEKRRSARGAAVQSSASRHGAARRPLCARGHRSEPLIARAAPRAG